MVHLPQPLIWPGLLKLRCYRFAPAVALSLRWTLFRATPSAAQSLSHTRRLPRSRSSGYFQLERGDKAGRRAKYRGNYEFWGAPVHLILCCPSDAVEGTFLDMGSYMTAVLLGAHAHGLGAKPQFRCTQAVTLPIVCT